MLSTTACERYVLPDLKLCIARFVMWFQTLHFVLKISPEYYNYDHFLVFSGSLDTSDTASMCIVCILGFLTLKNQHRNINLQEAQMVH